MLLEFLVVQIVVEWQVDPVIRPIGEQHGVGEGYAVDALGALGQ